MFTIKTAKKWIIVLLAAYVGVFALSWIYNKFLYRLDTTRADKYYDVLARNAKPSENFILDLGIKDNDDPVMALGRIKTALGLDKYSVCLNYHGLDTPPAYIENNNGILTIYLSAKIKKKSEQLNVLTHELCHVYVWDIDKTLKEGCDEEKIVDTSGVFLGLGIPILNGFTDEFYVSASGQQRFEKKGFGYLTPGEFGYMLARYMSSENIPEELITPFLTSTGHNYFNEGVDCLKRKKEIIETAEEGTGIAYWCRNCGDLVNVTRSEKSDDLKCPRCSARPFAHKRFDIKTLIPESFIEPFGSFLNKKCGSISLVISDNISRGDNTVFEFIRMKLRNPACDRMVEALSKIQLRSAVILLAVIAFFLGNTRLKNTALILIFALTVTSLVYSLEALGAIFRKPVPLQIAGTAGSIINFDTGRKLTPEFVATLFCLGTVLSARYPLLRYISFAAAPLVILAGPYAAAFYPSTAAAAALLGAISGYLAARTADNSPKRVSPRKRR
ncbi:MAG: hypothetical protein HQL30_12580 [Candidatus Omnitrophica bacterium]|nr:hypothetical protein [Candidatus Omnitrophota bacterium]